MATKEIVKCFFYEELSDAAKDMALKEFEEKMYDYFPTGIVDWDFVSENISENIIQTTKENYDFFFKGRYCSNKNEIVTNENIFWENNYGLRVDYSNLALSEDVAVDIIKKAFEEKKESGKMTKEEYKKYIEKMNVIDELGDYPGVEILDNSFDGVLDFELDTYSFVYYGISEILDFYKVFNPEEYKSYRLIHSLSGHEEDGEYIKDDEKEEIIINLQEKIFEFGKKIQVPLRKYIKRYKEEIEEIITSTIDYYESSEFLLDELNYEESFIYETIKFDENGFLVEL